MQIKSSSVMVSLVILLVAVILGSLAGNIVGDKYTGSKRDNNSRKIVSSLKEMRIGDTLPNFKFESIDGDSIWLSDLLSDKCVLAVTLPQCQDCISEAKELRLALKDTSDGKYFIFVTWENPKLVEDIRNENKLTSPFLYDHKRVYFSQFDISTYPFNITLDKNGVVLDMLAGSMLKEDFEEIIEFNRNISIAEN